MFVSIVESNSRDRTKTLLYALRSTLRARGVPHRILSYDDDDRQWPYGTSPERIAYLANVRNQALEPLQSDNASVRLDNYESYTRILFLNDVYFDFRDILQLLGTRGADSEPNSDDLPDYDLACAMDFGWSGKSLSAAPTG